MAVQVDLRELRKCYGQAVAVETLSLSLVAGEITSLLGPSGCGKTTTLRMIAGFESTDQGEILFDGVAMNNVAPERRNVGMLFQNYCLFPHMTVAENVAFGLKMRKIPKGEVAERTTKILDVVQLSQLAERYPRQLSGGQQQRVALARALVVSPAILLLDEPLGALDKSLRESMQFELKRIQRRFGPTTVIVTHDQEEALTLSSRVAVMQNGSVLQYGDPQLIYNRPNSKFVAEFLGTANFFEVTPAGSENGSMRVMEDGAAGSFFYVDPSMFSAAKPGERLMVAVRPERITLSGEEPAERNRRPGTISEAIFRGQSLAVEIRLQDGRRVQVVMPSRDIHHFETGKEVWVSWPEPAMIPVEDNG